HPANWRFWVVSCARCNAPARFAFPCLNRATKRGANQERSRWQTRCRGSAGARRCRVAARRRPRSAAPAGKRVRAAGPAAAAPAAPAMQRSRLRNVRRGGGGACASLSRVADLGAQRAFVAAARAAWLATGAVDAAAFSAGTAPLHDAFPQRLTGAEDAHASVVGGDARFGRVVLDGNAVHVDATQRG